MVTRTAIRVIGAIILLVLFTAGLAVLFEKREKWKREQEKQLEEQRRAYIEGE
jgi:hypothetical protein